MTKQIHISFGSALISMFEWNKKKKKNALNLSFGSVYVLREDKNVLSLCSQIQPKDPNKSNKKLPIIKEKIENPIHITNKPNRKPQPDRESKLTPGTFARGEKLPKGKNAYKAFINQNTQNPWNF